MDPCFAPISRRSCHKPRAPRGQAHACTSGTAASDNACTNEQRRLRAHTNNVDSGAGAGGRAERARPARRARQTTCTAKSAEFTANIITHRRHAAYARALQQRRAGSGQEAHAWARASGLCGREMLRAIVLFSCQSAGNCTCSHDAAANGQLFNHASCPPGKSEETANRAKLPGAKRSACPTASACHVPCTKVAVCHAGGVTLDLRKMHSVPASGGARHVGHAA